MKTQHEFGFSNCIAYSLKEHMEISRVYTYDLPEYSQLHSSKSKVILNTPVGDA